MTTPSRVSELRAPWLQNLGPHSLTLLQWHVDEGEAFEPSKMLVELISLQGVYSLQAPEGGEITEILVAEGSAVSPGETIALLRYGASTGG